MTLLGDKCTSFFSEKKYRGGFGAICTLSAASVCKEMFAEGFPKRIKICKFVSCAATVAAWYGICKTNRLTLNIFQKR